jgi:hypothetical protein
MQSVNGGISWKLLKMCLGFMNDNLHPYNGGALARTNPEFLCVFASLREIENHDHAPNPNI